VFALSSSFASAAAFATATNCQPQDLISGRVQIQKNSFSGNNCFVSVRLANETKLTYRDYTITDKGLLMVFNSFGNGPESQSTGAREFYFFPRTREVDFSVDPRSKDVIVHAPNGDDFIFAAGTAEIKSMGRGHLTVDHKISPGNNGGVEISNYKGLWLDLGFALGHSPAQEPERQVSFHNSAGGTCNVHVKDIFTQVNDEPMLRFSDQELIDYLNYRCMNFH
jgi:hypothetical protein